MPIPSKWVDTITNIHEKHRPDYVPEFKSRLVSCGNFEDAEGVRTDALTSDIETHALVAMFAACHGVPLFFVGHQERIFPGDANRPHSDNALTARRATRSRPRSILAY